MSQGPSIYDVHAKRLFLLPPPLSTWAWSTPPRLVEVHTPSEKITPFLKIFSDFGYPSCKFSIFHLPKFLMTLLVFSLKKFSFSTWRRHRKFLNSLYGRPHAPDPLPLRVGVLNRWPLATMTAERQRPSEPIGSETACNRGLSEIDLGLLLLLTLTATAIGASKRRRYINPW